MFGHQNFSAATSSSASGDSPQFVVPPSPGKLFIRKFLFLKMMFCKCVPINFYSEVLDSKTIDLSLKLLYSTMYNEIVEFKNNSLKEGVLKLPSTLHGCAIDVLSNSHFLSILNHDILNALL